jgi:agmatinase
MGMRGGLFGPEDVIDTHEMGFTLLPWDDLAQLGTGAAAAAVDRAGGKAFLTFDMDFVDPAYAPGTGTPECGGPTSMQALALLRACRGLDIAAADVVEVLPDLDSSHLTAHLAATVAWEILSLIAVERPEAAARSPEAGA